MPAIDGYAAQRGRVAPAGSAIDPFESLGQEEPKITFSLRWWEAYLSARRAAVVAPRSGRSFATLIGDAGVRVDEPLPMRACSYVSSLGRCATAPPSGETASRGGHGSHYTCEYHLNPFSQLRVTGDPV